MAVSVESSSREYTDRLAHVRREYKDRIAQVRRIEAYREQHAAIAIADGLFNSADRYWEQVLWPLAERKTAETREVLRAMFEKLEGLEPDSTKVPGDAHQWADDALSLLLTEWGELGFEMGLAIGMQLGSHAFTKGGDR